MVEANLRFLNFGSMAADAMNLQDRKNISFKLNLIRQQGTTCQAAANNNSEDEVLGGHWGGIRNSEGGVQALRAGSGRNRLRVIIYFSVSNHAESPGIVAKN